MGQNPEAISTWPLSEHIINLQKKQLTDGSRPCLADWGREQSLWIYEVTSVWRRQAGPELCFTHSSIVLTDLLLKGSKSLPKLSFIKMAKMERNAFPGKPADLGSALSPLPLSTGKHSQGEGKEELRSAGRYTLNALKFALC